MGFFNGEPSDWEVNALIIISRQLHSMQRKLDTLLTSAANVPPEQLAELTKESAALKAQTDALSEAIEKQQTERPK